MQTADTSAAHRVADYLELTKPGITRMVLVTTAAGYALGASGRIELFGLLHTVLGTGLVSAGAGALNHEREWRIDARMNRTRDRPVPAGRVRPRTAMLFGGLLAVLGLVYLQLFTTTAAVVLAALSLISYVAVYTPLKPVTSVSTLIGGIPGALPILVGWAGTGRPLGPAAWSLFGIMFLWQIPHFLALAWLYRDDYRRGGLAMISVQDPEGEATSRQAMVYALALLPVSLLPTLYGLAGGLYFLVALVSSSTLLVLAAAMARRRDARRARRLFFGSLVYLPIIMATMVVDRWLV